MTSRAALAPILPADWNWVKLEDVVEFLDHLRVPIKELERNARTAGLSASALFPYYGANGQAGWIDSYLFDEELVLLAEDGGSFGSSMAPIAYRVSGKCWVNNHAHVLRPGPSLDPDWLWVTLAIRPDVAEYVSGSTRPKLNQQLARAIPIPLPPLPEQHRIVAGLRDRLAAVAQAGAAAAAQLEAAQALRKAYLHRTFQGITPLAGGSMRDPTPAGWRWTRLTDLARLESGHTPSRYHPEWWGGDIPWIALPDIRNLDGKTAHRTIEYTNEAGIAHSSARVLPAGTVVLSRTASVGFVTIMGREMATSQDFVNWVCGPDLAPEFLSYLLQASRSYIRSLSSGATHQTVYVPTVKAFKVCIPSLSEQRQLADALTSQLSKVAGVAESAQQQVQAIGVFPQTLLGRAFSGDM